LLLLSSHQLDLLQQRSKVDRRPLETSPVTRADFATAQRSTGHTACLK
jgi:hypothetical protein